MFAQQVQKECKRINSYLSLLAIDPYKLRFNAGDEHYVLLINHNWRRQS